MIYRKLTLAASLTYLLCSCNSSFQLSECTDFKSKTEKVSNRLMKRDLIAEKIDLRDSESEVNPRLTASVGDTHIPIDQIIESRYKPGQNEALKSNLKQPEKPNSQVRSSMAGPIQIENSNSDQVLEKTKKKNVNGASAKGQATAALVLGILSLFIAGIPLGILAIVFGTISMNKLEKGKGRGMAIAGLVLGIIGVVGALAFLAVST